MPGSGFMPMGIGRCASKERYTIDQRGELSPYRRLTTLTGPGCPVSRDASQQ